MSDSSWSSFSSVADDDGIIIDLTGDNPVVVGYMVPLISVAPVLINLLSEGSASDSEDNNSVATLESRDSMADLVEMLDLGDAAYLEHEQDALDEEDELEDVEVIRQVPELHVVREMTGTAWNTSRERRQIRQLQHYLPDEDISYTYETYLMFQEKILMVPSLRYHAACFGCWRVDGDPVDIDGLNHRFQFQDLPYWVMIGPGRDMNGMSALDTFYAKMAFSGGHICHRISVLVWSIECARMGLEVGCRLLRHGIARRPRCATV